MINKRSTQKVNRIVVTRYIQPDKYTECDPTDLDMCSGGDPELPDSRATLLHIPHLGHSSDTWPHNLYKNFQ